MKKKMVYLQNKEFVSYMQHIFRHFVLYRTKATLFPIEQDFFIFGS